MGSSEIENELGRRDFIRSAALLGTGLGATALVGACSETAEQPLSVPSSVVVEGRKWVQADSFDPTFGEFTSLSTYSDAWEGSFTADIEMRGHSVLSSGAIVPVTKVIDKDVANSLVMVSAGGDLYRVEKNGIPQPPGAPYEFHLVEREISGTDITVLTGYSVNPTTGNRIRFNVTRNQTSSRSSALVRYAVNPVVVIVIVIVVVLVIATPAHGQGAGG